MSHTGTPTATGPLSTIAVLIAGMLTTAAHANTGGSWTTVAPMDVPRQEAATVRVGDAVYVAGGLVGVPGNASATTSLEIYDIALDAWSTGADLPAGRDHAGYAAIETDVYLVGGYVVEVDPFDDLFVYDTVGDAWTTGLPLPSPRGAGAMVAIGDRLYYFGGVGPAGVTNTTYIHDKTLGWFEGEPMPTPREHQNAVVLDGLAYVIGGRAGPATDALERYDPTTDMWTTLAAMPTARSAMAMAVFDGEIHCAGGETPQLHDVHEVYDPVANAWSCMAPMDLPRHGLGAVAVDGGILVPAGGTIQGFLPTNHVDVWKPDPIVSTGESVHGSTSAPRRLAPPSPNPFLASTTLSLTLEGDTVVSVNVLDAAGRHVRTLVSRAMRAAGTVRLAWDGLDEMGRETAAGTYFIEVMTPAGRETRRVVRMH